MQRIKNAVKTIVIPCVLMGGITFHLQASPQDSTATDPIKTNISQAKKGPEIKGEVKDAVTGKPLAGINISLPGFSAAITDDTGRFSIIVPNLHTTLIVEGEGFHTKEVALKGRSSVSTVLYETTFESVYDQVNLPYTKKLANHVSGAVKSVNVYDAWNRYSGESADTYLQGKVAGLNAVRRSGTPGIGASLFLRGYTSLNSSNQPLIIVDGILYDNTDFGISLLSGHVENPIANLDLKDVDNITVIKDATASSYGVKAANGVILITTSKSKSLATKIDFGAIGGFNTRPSTIPVLSSGGFRTYLSDALGGYMQNIGYTPVAAQEFVQSQKFMTDDMDDPEFFKYHYSTNWQNKILTDSYNQNYYLKVTGGDNIATYGLSVGFLNNQGVTDKTDLQRYQTRFNADLNFTNKLKGIANLSFISNRQNLKDQGLAFNTNPILLSLTKAPFLGLRDVSAAGVESPNYADVDILGKSNPAAIIENMDGVNSNYRFMGSVGFNYEFTKRLNLIILGGVTYSKVRENIFIPQRGVMPLELDNAVALNRSGTNVERLYSLFSDARLNYARSFNNVHNLNASVGFRYNTNKMEADYGLGYNSATDDYVTVGNGQAALRRISGENGQWNWLNTYASIDYDFSKKYFASFNLAVDGSSRFGMNIPDVLTVGGAKLAVMPSVSAGWLLSSEDFFSALKGIELLKLRASYGLVGNDDMGNYTAKQYYKSQSFLGSQGLVRGNIANTALRWETVEKLNLGLDASFLKERLSFSLDWFSNQTRDMLMQEAVLAVTGFDYAVSNNGGMKTNGFELAVSGRLLNRNLKWDMGLTLSKYRTEITRIPGDRLVTGYAGANILTQKGMASNLFYGFKTAGVYATDADASSLQSLRADGTIVPFKGGDLRFIDLNGDKYIDDNDRQVIGNPNPDFVGMLNNRFAWKRFSMDALFTFSVGNDVYNFMRRELESMSGLQNQSPKVLNRWKAQGQITDVPRAIIGDPAGNARFSDRWIEDGSYLRLRTLTVAYDFPVANKAIKQAKVYLTGNNIFTITKYLGYDPEFSATSSVFTQGIDTVLEPQFRTIQLGVRIGL
ncbi:MAG: SusC/RagA family TonB-linked outer membrane protein [Arcticibacter sp.]